MLARKFMHNVPASLVTNLGDATIISACALGIGFMLRFLRALTKERKTSLARFCLEYRINSSSPNNATTRPQTPPNRSEAEYDRGRFFCGTPQALKEAALPRDYRFTAGFRQGPIARDFSDQPFS